MSTFVHVVGKAVDQAVTMLEKSTESRVFLHVLCAVLYLDASLCLLTGAGLVKLDWVSAERYLHTGNILLIFLGYLALMGYVFHLIYAFAVTYVAGWVYLFFGFYGRVGYRDVPGYVHERDVLRVAYTEKNDQLFAEIKAHKIQCNKDRQEIRNLSYLAFAALCLGVCGWFFTPEGALRIFDTFIVHAIDVNVTNLVECLLVLPVLMIIYFDISYDSSRCEYIKHYPLYEKIMDERRENEKSMGY